MYSVKTKGPNAAWTASASSFHQGLTQYQPSYAIDGVEAPTNLNIFVNGDNSQLEWFQLDLGQSYYVKAVEIVYRSDSVSAFEFEKFKEVHRRVIGALEKSTYLEFLCKGIILAFLKALDILLLDDIEFLFHKDA